jgi:hypothetical protein
MPVDGPSYLVGRTDERVLTTYVVLFRLRYLDRPLVIQVTTRIRRRRIFFLQVAYRKKGKNQVPKS